MAAGNSTSPSIGRGWRTISAWSAARCPPPCPSCGRRDCWRPAAAISACCVPGTGRTRSCSDGAGKEPETGAKSRGAVRPRGFSAVLQSCLGTAAPCPRARGQREAAVYLAEAVGFKPRDVAAYLISRQASTLLTNTSNPIFLRAAPFTWVS